MKGPRKRSFGPTSEESGAEAPEGEPSGDGAAPEGFAERFGSAPTRSVISRKELARELRRQAYQRAKQARANDPRHQAIKERAKQQRRDLYQKVKEQRKAREAELEARHAAERGAARAEAKRQLAERVRGAVGKASNPGRDIAADIAPSIVADIAPSIVADIAPSIARDIDRALESAGVRELMERLRRESAALAAKHRDALRDEGDEGDEGPTEHDAFPERGGDGDDPDTCSP